MSRVNEQVERLQRIVRGLSAELGPEGSRTPFALDGLEEADAVGTLLPKTTAEIPVDSLRSP